MKKLSLFALAALAVSLSAQTPFLVSDINTTVSFDSQSSSPETFFAAGNAVYFTAHLQATGRELWKVENGQPSLVADIAAGTVSSSPSQFGVLRDDLILFAATTGVHGPELWATDGTTQGTRLVKDIHPSAAEVLFLRAMANGKLFFTANDGVHGVEPWVTDGTTEGTRLLLDLDGTSASSNVQTIAPFGPDRVLIFANGGIWSSDGTPEGTTPVVTAGTTGSVTGYARVGTTAYFTSFDTAGWELWKTNGTAGGTTRVKDIAPGFTSGIHSTRTLIVMGGHVYFIASETGSTFDLWRSDGTEAGTQRVLGSLVQIVSPGVTPNPTLHGDGMRVYVRSNRGLWASDGTAGGTILVDTDLSSQNFTVAFGGLYYLKSVSGRSELWATNGTTQSTRSVRRFTDITVSGLLRFTGGKLYFAASDGLHGTEPWVCADAGGAVIEMLANVNPDGPPSSSPAGLAAGGNLVYFTADDGTASEFRRELWRSDGTSAGTFRVTGLGDSSNGARISLFTGWRGGLFFEHRLEELWRSDGTVAGTMLVKDLGTTPVSELFPAEDFLYLDAASTLWGSDGTATGTLPIGQNKVDFPDGFAELAGRVYMTGSGNNRNIFVTQGTAESTKRITSFASNESPTTGLVTAAGALFFGGRTDAAGDELWSSDGTTDGTVLVKDIVAGAGSSTPRQLTGGGRYVFFVANDGTHGNEVWRSDGTAEGTILLRDILPGTASSSPRDLTMNGPVLYFVADDGLAGAELWRSDGTPAGTVMVSDLRFSASSDPKELFASDGTLWFVANNGTHGEELWRTTNIEGVTPTLVADLAPGEESSSPAEIVRAGDLLYFAAWSSGVGRELWALDLPADPAISVSDVRVVEGNGGTMTARFTVTRIGDTAAPSSATFTTIDASATAGLDYVASSGIVSFDAGVATQFVDVVVNGDTDIEKNESFLVMLTGATGAVLRDSSGAAVIEDDDARADVSVEWVSSTSGKYTVRITNNGPSRATNVVVSASHSPGKVTVCGFTANPADCNVGELAGGESRTLDIPWHTSAPAFTNPNEPPGTTVTADVRATEPDPNTANNLVARMVGARLEMPPFLTNGATSNVTLRIPTTISQTSNVAITTQNPFIVIDPGTAPIPAGQTTAAFTITPQTFAGRVLLSTGWSPGGGVQKVAIDSVQAGGTPKLDVAAVVATSFNVTVGNPIQIPIEIAARRHDGTLPTGTVALVDANGATLAQQALDGNASTAFSRSDVARGTHNWELRYSGDTHFNALTIPVTVTVSGIPTSTSIEVPPFFCGGVSAVTVRVQNLSTSEVPPGSVNVLLNGVTHTLALSPSGASGEAIATTQLTFAMTDRSIGAFYDGTAVFASSNSGAAFLTANCGQFNLTATASGGTVTLSWTPQPGAHHYVVHSLHDPFTWAFIGSTEGTQFIHETGTSGKVVLYTVNAQDASGNILSYSGPEIAYTKSFMDDPFVPGATKVKALHVSELQLGASALRRVMESSGLTFPAATAGTQALAARVLELRTAINRYRIRIGLPAVAWTDPGLAIGSKIKAVHLQELRNALK